MKPYLPAALWLTVVTILSVSPNVQLPKFELFSADKLAHAGAYALLFGLLVWGVRKSKDRAATRGEMLLFFCLATGYGALMEWVQGTFFPYRLFEYDDMLANAAGAFLALILTNSLSKNSAPKPND